MALIKFKIEAEFDEVDVEGYAIYKGWKPTNPLSKDAFICEKFKDITVREIAEFVKRKNLTAVTANYNTNIAQAKAAIEANIAQAITVTSEPIEP